MSHHRYIKDKLRLTVCDALSAQFHADQHITAVISGRSMGVMTAVDPVALDAIGYQIIDDKRVEIGMEPLKVVDREPGYIDAAGRLKLGQGGSKKY